MGKVTERTAARLTRWRPVVRRTYGTLRAPRVVYRIYPPMVWRYIDENNMISQPYELYDRAMAKNKPGDRLYSHYAPPGCGIHVAQITRMDETGVYGFTVESTLRMLEPEDVR